MADLAYFDQIQQLRTAAEICDRHRITDPVNGIQPDYPRWPEAFAACEIVWRNYLDLQTLEGANDEADRETVMREAGKLR